MTGTYEMIRALPAKGTNWRALLSALIENYLAEYAAKHNGAEPWGGNTTDVWNAARTVRDLRTAAMEAANFAVGLASQRSTYLAPTQETLSWGGFLGGETVVWKDADAQEAAIAHVAEIIKRHA
jgi:hypothetical protein